MTHGLIFGTLAAIYIGLGALITIAWALIGRRRKQ